MSTIPYAEAIDENWEYIKFGVYAAGLALSTLLLIGMFAEAFANRSPLKISIIRLFSIIPVLNLVNFLAILLGAYFGLLLLLFLDKKKRPQSILFLSVSLITLLGFLLTDVFFDFAGPLEIPAFVIGFIATLLLFGGNTLSDVEFSVNPNSDRLVDLPRQEPLEFPKAEVAMVYLLSAFVLIALFEAHTSRQALVVLIDGLPAPNTSVFATTTFIIPEPPSWLQFMTPETTSSLYLLGTIGFLGFTKLFVGYDAEKRVVFIGPQRSGKTHCVLGCFLEAQNNNLARNPSVDLLTYKKELVQNQAWIPPTENEVHRLRFEYSIGTFFRRNIVADGLDYPGEYSRYIADGLRLISKKGMYVPESPSDDPPGGYETHQEAAVNETSEECREFVRAIVRSKDDMDDIVADGVELRVEEGYGLRIDMENNILESRLADLEDIFTLMISEILPRIQGADVLVYLFDGKVHKRIAHQGGLRDEDEARREVTYYQRISSLQNRHRRTVGVVSKADLLKDEFLAENSGKRINRHYEDDFRPWLETDILAGPFADVLRAEEITPIPVFFLEEDVPADEINQQGDTRPVIDRGQPQYKGFQQLLEAIK